MVYTPNDNSSERPPTPTPPSLCPEPLHNLRPVDGIHLTFAAPCAITQPRLLHSLQAAEKIKFIRRDMNMISASLDAVDQQVTNNHDSLINRPCFFLSLSFFFFFSTTVPFNGLLNCSGSSTLNVVNEVSPCRKNKVQKSQTSQTGYICPHREKKTETWAGEWRLCLGPWLHTGLICSPRAVANYSGLQILTFKDHSNPPVFL